MLGRGPAARGGELARINETRVRGARVYPFANSVGPPVVVPKPVKVVDDPGLPYRKARVIAAPEKQALTHLQVSLPPEVQCVLVRSETAETAVVVNHRQPEAGREVHHLRSSSLLVLIGLHGLQSREPLVSVQ